MFQSKRFATALCILGICILSAAWPAISAAYSTRQISTLGGASLGLFPKVNSKGEVAWSGNFYDSPGLYLYSDGKVTQLTDNPNIQNFDINDLGQVVWSGLSQSTYGYDIFLYKNGDSAQITFDGNNNFDPSLNDEGDFVWNSYNGEKALIRLCARTGAVSTIWTCPSWSDLNTNYVFPVINNQGQVAWRNYSVDALANPVDNIYLYSGGGAVSVYTCPSFTSFLEYTDPLHSLNNIGDLVFSGSDGILLKKNGAAVQEIAATTDHSSRPRINDSGLVAYVGNSAEYSTAVYLYDSSTGSQKITDNGTHPFLNNTGQLIWTDTQGIHLYYRNASSRIVSYGYSVYPTMNDKGQVAWQGEFSGDGVFLSRPAADQPAVQLLLLQ